MNTPEIRGISSESRETASPIMVTIEDSLSSTPRDMPSALDDSQKRDSSLSSECAKVDDSYMETSVTKDSPFDGGSAQVEPNKHSDSCIDISGDFENEQRSFQSEQYYAQSSKGCTQREHVDSKRENIGAQSCSADVCSKPVDTERACLQLDSPGAVQSEFESIANDFTDTEGSYIHMTEPFENIDPGIIMSPVLDLRPQALLFPGTAASESNWRHEETIDNGRTSDVTSTDAELGENINRNMESFVEDENQLLPARKDDSESEQQSANSQVYETSSISGNEIDLSHQTSFSSDYLTDTVEESTYEVIDAACSPMSITLRSPGYPVTGQDYESSSPGCQSEEKLRNFRDLEKNLRKNACLPGDMQKESATSRTDLPTPAQGLECGLAESFDGVESNESGVSIEVIDAACSPMSIKESDSEVADESTRRDSNVLQLEGEHVTDSSMSDYAVEMKGARRHSSRRPESLEPKAVRCSTPHDGQSLPVTKAITDYDARSSLQEPFMKIKLFSPGELLDKPKESFRRSEGLVSRSVDSEQYQGSGSLFSTSFLSEEAKANGQNASSKLTISNGAQGSLQHVGLESLLSDQILTESKQNSRASSKLGGSIREETEDSSKFCRSFNLESQETSTLRYDEILIKNHYVSESDSDILSNKSDLGLNGDQSYHSHQIIKSDNEDTNDDDNEIVMKVQKSLDFEAFSDQSDYCASDADSVSSNELNMMSVLSGNRQSPPYHNSSASNVIDNYQASSVSSGESDSGDEQLMRSRRSFRMSIMGLPRLPKSPESADLSCANPEATGNLDASGVSEENDATAGKHDSRSEMCLDSFPLDGGGGCSENVTHYIF